MSMSTVRAYLPLPKCYRARTIKRTVVDKSTTPRRRAGQTKGLVLVVVAPRDRGEPDANSYQHRQAVPRLWPAAWCWWRGSARVSGRIAPRCGGPCAAVLRGPPHRAGVASCTVPVAISSSRAETRVAERVLRSGSFLRGRCSAHHDYRPSAPCP